MADRPHVTDLLDAVARGEEKARDELFERVYQELKRIARSQLRRSGDWMSVNPTTLLHEAWLKFARADGRELQGSTHFYNILSQAMRHVLTDIARSRITTKRGHQMVRVELNERIEQPESSLAELLAVDTALEKLQSCDPDIGVRTGDARTVALRPLGTSPGTDVETFPEIARFAIDSCVRLKLINRLIMMLSMPGRSASANRSPGRPLNARGDQRARLLDAALALFSRQGIAETSLSAIARRARVTPALVHYYFGSREQLLDALMDERIAPLVARIGVRLSESGNEPGAVVRAFVGTMIGMLADNPWLPPLWVREVLSENGALRERLLTRIAPRIAPQLAERFAEAKRRGLLNPGLDPRLTVVSLIGLTIFPLAAQSIWRRLLDADDIDTDALIAHTLALLDGGLRAKGTQR